MSKILVFSPSQELYLLDRLGYKLFDSRLAERIYDWPNEEQLSDSRPKVAVIKWIRYQHELDKFDFSWADLIICISSEIVHEPWEIYDIRSKSVLNHDNIIYVVGGINNSHKDSYPKDKFFYPYLFFFLTVAQGNTPQDYPDERPYLFDALLGQKKEYRLKLFDRLKEHGLLDQCLLSMKNSRYMSRTDYEDYQTPGFDQYEDPYVQDLINRSNGDLTAAYLGNGVEKTFPNTHWKISASALIPHKIYANSWYSIVAESEQHNYTFFTEKISKCLFAKRIFIVFASQGYLQKLRDLGFKTFGVIMDESYDNETDPNIRFNKAFDQIYWLSKQNPEVIYSRVENVLKHNQKLLLESKLNYTEINQFIQKKILNITQTKDMIWHLNR